MNMRMWMTSLLAVLLALAASAATVTVNGKAVAVPMLEQNGKAYVDIVALMALLGGKASYDAAGHAVAITTAGAPAATTTGGGTAASAGTPQLAGDNGELGKIYSLSKSNPIYFTLKSAEFTTEQVNIGPAINVPEGDKKLLLLKFSIQNPLNTEQYVRGDTLRLTAVDAMNNNCEGISDWGDIASRGSVGITLKPSQKIECYTIIAVPATGVVPKLMVLPANDNDGPILRYDLRGKVAAVPAPIADPADATGATALETVPGKVNERYPYKNFDITLQKFAYQTTKIGDYEPEEGMRFLLVTALIKNDAASAAFLRSDHVTPTLVSTDGEEIDYKDMFFATAARSIGQELKPGQEMTVRLLFAVPKDVTPKTLTLKEGESRSYEFAVKE